MSFLDKIFGKSRISKSQKNQTPKSRRLGMESLESRELLAVSAAEFAAIKSQYVDLELTNYDDYNIIEVTADELSDAKIRNALIDAALSAQDDLIVVRTTASQNSVTLSGTELGINVDAATQGSVTIVSLGTDVLTIDADGKSRVFNIGATSDAALAGLAVTGGSALDGGGILNAGTLTATECTISKNSITSTHTGYGGGGIRNIGTLAITNSAVTGNSATTTGAYGGGINNSAVMTVTNCTISENNVLWYGAGIYNSSDGTLIVAHSFIVGNSAGVNGSGGGAYNSGEMTVTNSMIAGNRANSGGTYTGGGGIHNVGGLTVTNCTVAGNMAAMNSGGIYNCGSISGATSLVINNTIIAKNIVGTFSGRDLVNATREGKTGTISGGNNLIGNGSGQNSLAMGVDGNIVGTETGPIDPRFVTYSDYTTWKNDLWKSWDLRLAAASPAIDKGSNVLAVDADGNALQMDLDGKARISNGIIDIGAYEYQITPGTKLPTPTLLTVIATDNGMIDVEWAGVPNATGYILQYATNLTFTTGLVTRSFFSSDRSTTLDGLEANTTYYVRIMATGSGLYTDSDWSVVKSATTTSSTNQLATPTLTTVTAIGNDKIDVSWNGVDNAAGYMLQYATNSTFTAGRETKTLVSATRKITLDGLDANTTYYVRLAAVGSGIYVDSEWSAVKSATTTSSTSQLTAPTLTAVTAIGDGMIDVSWNGVDNAAGYTLQYATNSAFSSGLVTKPFFSDTRSTTLDKLDADTTYYVRIMATGTGLYTDSAWSAVKSATTTSSTGQLTAPTLTAVTAIGDGKIDVSWDGVDNAAGYVLQYATNSAFSAGLEAKSFSSATRSTTLDGLRTGITYYVRIMATATGSYTDSVWSAVKSTTTSPSTVQLTTPTLNSVTSVGNGKVDVSWNGVGNAAGYTLQYATNSTFTAGLETQSFSSTSRSATLDGLDADTTYYVRIMATGTGSYTDSDWSAVKSVTVSDDAPTAPANFRSVSQTADSVTLSWSAQGNLTGYTLEYKKSADSEWSTWTAPEATANGATITGLEVDTAYDFRLTAINDKGSASSTTHATTRDVAAVPDMPAAASAVLASGNRTQISWSAVDGATSYEIVGYNAAGNYWWKIDTTTDTFYDAPGYTTNVTLISVHAVNEAGRSKGKTTNILRGPGEVSAVAASGNQTQISWSAVAGATSYDIMGYNAVGKYWWKIDSVTDTSYVALPYTTNVTTIAIHAIRGDERTMGTAASIFRGPENVSAVAAASSTNISWSLVPGATSYDIMGYNAKEKYWWRIDTTTDTSYVALPYTTNVTTIAIHAIRGEERSAGTATLIVR